MIYNMKNKGFTLIEFSIAVFLISVAVVGSFAVLQQVILSNSLSSSKIVASYLAQEGIEIVRNIRDTQWLLYGEDVNWNSIFAACGSGCELDYDEENAPVAATGRYLKIGGNGFYNYESGTMTKFKRKVIIVISGDKYEVTVEVTWEERGRTHTITVREDLYNWFRLAPI